MEGSPYNSGESSIDSEGENEKSTFRKVLKIFFIGVGVIVVLVLALVAFVGFQTSKTYSSFDGEAEVFIEKFLKDQSPWDFNLAKPRISKLWIDSIELDHSVKLFKHFNKLGYLKSVTGVEWQRCSTSSHTSTGTVNRCDFVAMAEYEKGEASIAIGLVNEDGAPKILQLQVNSDAFLE